MKKHKKDIISGHALCGIGAPECNMVSSDKDVTCEDCNNKITKPINIAQHIPCVSGCAGDCDDCSSRNTLKFECWQDAIDKEPKS